MAADVIQFSSVTQSCPTLCDPMDCSPPGSSIPGIFQARVLEWVAIAFSERIMKALDLQLSQTEAVVYTYNGILLSHKKTTIWASPNEADEPKACYTVKSVRKRKTNIIH